MWISVLNNLRALHTEPPDPPAQARRSQNVVGLSIAEAALAHAIEKKPEYVAAAKKWMDAAVSYDVWGYTYSKPNVDLAAGHLLFGLGWGYDLLYHEFTPVERKKYRDKIVRQARLLYKHYRVKPGRTFAYSQNHVYIPNAGLAVAAYALYGEVPEAAEWAKLSRAIMGRSLDTYSKDGYFYESFEYWVFAAPWLVIWTTAHAHFTGEELFDRPGFRAMHKYLAHVVLPDRVNVFDFADAYSGGQTRSRQTPDYERTHPGGKLHSNYNLLHATAGWFGDSAAQGVAQFYREQGHVTWYGFMSLLWYDANVPAAPIESLEPYHHFADHGVVFYRSDWTPSATAFAFKCGPPEGYATVQRQARFPDWHLSPGHAHPDANSFILFANGEYLTGDSGYSGVPRTDQHNSVLINNRGQRFTEDGHNAFKGASYARLAATGLTIHKLGRDGLHVVGDATAAYPDQLGLRRFVREVTMTSGSDVRIVDQLEAESPAIFTLLFHSDGSIKQKSANLLTTTRNRSTLEIEVTTASELTTEVEPNWMTGPGRPGSVHKGEREARGYRARISNKAPARTAQFVSNLTVR
ncbi:MAG: heparinase II/III family protein [Proteobacteria bacterium]|nr:heparinase II/III family protein [Pseudomonadota bacterium]